VLRPLLSALLFLASVLLFGRYRGGDESLAGRAAAAAPLDRLQGAIEQEEQAGDDDDGENEDHVHARQFLVVDGLAGSAPPRVHALPRPMAAMLQA